MEYLKLGLIFFKPFVVYEVDCNLVGSEISASLSQLAGGFFFFFPLWVVLYLREWVTLLVYFDQFGRRLLVSG